MGMRARTRGEARVRARTRGEARVRVWVRGEARVRVWARGEAPECLQKGVPIVAMLGASMVTCRAWGSSKRLAAEVRTPAMGRWTWHST